MPTLSWPPHVRRFLAVLLAGLLPWTVVLTDGGASLVFAFGLVSLDPLHLVPLDDYLLVHTSGLPYRLRAWPLGVVLHAGAVISAAAGLLDREDPRLTAGLLVLAGLAHARVAVGLYTTHAGSGSDAIVLPLGAIGAWTVAWVAYRKPVAERGLWRAR